MFRQLINYFPYFLKSLQVGLGGEEVLDSTN